MLGLPLAFTVPAVLGALALLPALYFLLRVTPPRPRQLPFPPLRLILDLRPREEKPARTPPWLLLLRLAIAAAVILAWAAWPMRAIRWPAILLNGAMLVSAVPIGGHYLIDIVAGCVVAAIGISIARKIGEPAASAKTYRPPSRLVSAATQLARSIVLPSGSRASR